MSFRWSGPNVRDGNGGVGSYPLFETESQKERESLGFIYIRDGVASVGLTGGNCYSQDYSMN